MIFISSTIFLISILLVLGSNSITIIQQADSTSQADKIRDKADDVGDDIEEGSDDLEDSIKNKLGNLGTLDDNSNEDLGTLDNDNDNNDEELEKLYSKCVNSRIIAGQDTNVCIDPSK